MYYQPTSTEEIKEILALARQQNKRVKVVGGGHSPSDIACTDGFMIHMGKMNRVLQLALPGFFLALIQVRAPPAGHGENILCPLSSAQTS